MASSAPSIGDILMLSQQAWRIGCAFNGRANAPEAFLEIEKEIKGLTSAITLLAERVDVDGGLLAQADQKTQEGLAAILSSARHTLNNLESFVSQYQETRRSNEAGGSVPKRVWKQALVQNYQTIVWTTDGGGWESLKNMLAMHTHSVAMATRALQSRSLKRLENTVEPVAAQMNNLHTLPGRLNSESAANDARSPQPEAAPPPFIPNRTTSDIDGKIDEMIQDLSLTNMKTLRGAWPDTTSPSSSLSKGGQPSSSKHIPEPIHTSRPIHSIPEQPWNSSSFDKRSLPSPLTTPEFRQGDQSADVSPESSYGGKNNLAGRSYLDHSPPSSYESNKGQYMNTRRPEYTMGGSYEYKKGNKSQQSPQHRDQNPQSPFGPSIADLSSSDSAGESNSPSKGLYPGGAAHPGRLVPLHDGRHFKASPNQLSPDRQESNNDPYYMNRHGPKNARSLSADSCRTPASGDYRLPSQSQSPPQSRRNFQESDLLQIGSYPPKMDAKRAYQDLRRTASERQSDLAYSAQTTNNLNSPSSATLPPPTNTSSTLPSAHPRNKNRETPLTFSPADIAHFAKTPSKEKPEKPVKKNIFSGLTILCEARGISVEFLELESGSQGDHPMVKACSECKIYLVTKHYKLESGDIRFMTSVWTLSDDGGTRIQQQMPEGEDSIPYTVWGNNTKVVLRFMTDLQFFDSNSDDSPTKTAKSAWVCYSFESAQDNLSLWSAYFEPEHPSTLFQSSLMGKRLILSVKIRRVMRVHDGITGTFAFAEQLCGLENLRIFQNPDTGTGTVLIHYTPQFCQGYMQFNINGSHNPIRLTEIDDVVVRVRGIKVAVDQRKIAVDNGKTGHQKQNSVSDKPSKPTKSKSEKTILGAKIEFYTAMDKTMFMNTLKRVEMGGAF